ncbi:MAG: hypothetical protein GY870_09775 [archaeon]|nr:hypothetical protein [archaeon]
MSQMINDSLQNIYNRIAAMGQSISNLQQSLDNLTNTLNSKVEKITNSIASMRENQEKEGEGFKIVLESAGMQFLTEIKKLQSNIGLSDLAELTEKLKKIAATSEEALKPETVDVLLDEVLKGITHLMGRKDTEGGNEEDNTSVGGDMPAPPQAPPGAPPSS